MRGRSVLSMSEETAGPEADTFGRLGSSRQGSRPKAASPRADRRDGGFTLIESLTASTILLVVAIGVITTLVTTSGWYAQARLRTEANAVANQVMSLILSRNYSDIHYATAGESWPTGIPASMPWSSSYGEFNVETSMTPTVDPATGLDMKQVIVTAVPVGRTLMPAVSVIRYTSGWQQMSSNVSEFLVPVEVQLKQDGVDVKARGVRVQLRDVTTLAEVRYAVTNAEGKARFDNVVEGQYFLTADPRFGTDWRPKNFPTRIFPAHGGSANNPIMKVNGPYALEMKYSSTGAVLRVGAYRGAGFRNPVPAGDGTYKWDPPDAPYQPAEGVVVYAQPVLNSATSGSGLVGAGSTYPDESKLIYSASVNAFGVAVIPVPWTIEPAAGQRWRIWYTVGGSSGKQGEREDLASGSWTTVLRRPDLTELSDHVYADVPQWEHLVDLRPVTAP